MPEANGSAIAEKAEIVRFGRDVAADLGILGILAKVSVNSLIDAEQLPEKNKERSAAVKISVQVINDLLAPLTSSRDLLESRVSHESRFQGVYVVILVGEVALLLKRGEEIPQ